MHLKNTQFLIVIFIIMQFTNCKKSPEPDRNLDHPVTTIQASNISSDSALVGGNIVLNKDFPVWESGIFFDTTTIYTVTDKRVIKMVQSGTFMVSLKNLAPSTTYYFRAYIKNSIGYFLGNEYSFKTNPAPDTPNYVKKIEQYYNYNIRILDYSFYYDNTNRLIKVGIRNYKTGVVDTATCLLYYQGANPKPYKIITPTYNSRNGVSYDTVYFSYNSSNQIIKDSSNDLESFTGTQRIPTKREYQYLNSGITVVHWYSKFSLDRPQELWRSDTISDQTGDITAQFYATGNRRDNYAKASTLTYSNFINPLSMLNISGTIYTLIYHPNNREIFGNSSHKAVWNSNMLPYYLDFKSKKIPLSYFISGYTPENFSISANGDNLQMTITPWQARMNYPAEIQVISRSFRPGDSFLYKFYY